MTQVKAPIDRGRFSNKTVFIMAAIGSAVGLGNIWRFPYVAYEGGGGAFILPYLVALLVAGIPLLLLDYAIGHSQRGSAPLSFARLHRRLEFIGWWQVAICVVIAVYYAAILAWSTQYIGFSFTQAWGDDPEAFLFGDFLQTEAGVVSLEFVPAVLIPMAIIWLVTIVVMALGVQKGVGATSVIFIPVLLIAFGALVVQALMLPGAIDGLQSLFAPNWAALLDPAVWASAFGQIFFSLSVGFGIMITYASYVGRKVDMTGSAFVVGFANSGFELLAGIGVFSALGFLAQASGAAVADVVSAGIGLAFVAFPAIISQAPFGALLGVLFFASLVLAGFTSLVSILEVVISAVRDKLEMGRVAATLAVTVPMAIVSILLFSTRSGVIVLDIADYFINRFGILLVALVAMIAVGWGIRRVPWFAEHMSRFSSIRLGRWWVVLVTFVTPVLIALMLVQEAVTAITVPYEGYPAWMLGVFGWGAAGAALVAGLLLAIPKWKQTTPLEAPPHDEEVIR
ncbi:sodium-dependent transporter [Agrococcus sp. TF02-05]|uniref:sodium-dependent transporter n=1 Tax=Agrococcus sp. TF02-05 TaxID=2815211 RepID=UPI001AA11F18|nr:sodium-dependent transporter [Agrococcus sp. TF02-05]MBO1770372.1 sodium-dependent transporter [Agrococcus sp. TF02-05]